MATGKCILRVEKIKQAGGVSGYAHHNTRERETLNADPKKLSQNTVLAGPKTANQVMSVWRERIAKDANPRKNAVMALDYMVHASPECISAEDREKYLKAAYEWIAARHGRENVVQAVIHRDERTEAHLHVVVVPLKENKKGLQKLNASHWTDGRRKLSAMQTEFHEKVGRRFGLVRGLQGSKAKHQKVTRFYALVNQPYKGFKITVDRPPKLGAIMDLDHWKKGQEEGLSEAVSKAVEPLQAKARMAEFVQEKNQTLERWNKDLAKERDHYQKGYEDWHNAALNMPIDDLIKLRAQTKQKEQERENKQERNKDRGLTR